MSPAVGEAVAARRVVVWPTDLRKGARVAVDSGLATRASRGALASAGGQGLRIVVQMASVVVLARLLAPADYGLIAEVLTIVGLGEIFRDFGLSSAAVQAKRLSEAERSNLLWLNSLIGVALMVIACALSPAVALLYGDPRLTSVTLVLSLVFLINGVSTQFRADLNRNLMFGRTVTAEVAGQILGLGLGVFMALNGAGYWALVGQQLLQSAVTFVVVVAYARFRPQRYRRDVSMRRFLGFGFDVVGGQLLGYAGKNTDTFVIGTTMGTSALGYYNRAFQLLSLPLSQINAPATRVALSVLSRLHDDGRRYARYLLAGQTVMLHLVLAVFSLTAALAAPLIALVLGPQWGPSVPLFQALAVAGVFQTAGYATFWVFLSKGLTRSQLWWQVASRPVVVAIVALGALWGVQGVAIAYATASALAWAAGLLWIRRVADVPVRAMFTNVLKAVVGYALAAAAAWASLLLPTGAQTWSALLVGAAAWLLALALVTAAWPAFRRDVRTIVSVVRTFRAGRGRLAAAPQPSPDEDVPASVV